MQKGEGQREFGGFYTAKLIVAPAEQATIVDKTTVKLPHAVVTLNFTLQPQGNTCECRFTSTRSEMVQ